MSDVYEIYDYEWNEETEVPSKIKESKLLKLSSDKALSKLKWHASLSFSDTSTSRSLEILSARSSSNAEACSEHSSAFDSADAMAVAALRAKASSAFSLN